MEQDTGPQEYVGTILTNDQQMFCYHYGPIMGTIWCANELDVPLHLVSVFCREARIPKKLIDPEMSICEIAEEIGLPCSEVETILKRAMRKLRREFKKRDNLKDYRE